MKRNNSSLSGIFGVPPQIWCNGVVTQVNRNAGWGFIDTTQKLNGTNRVKFLLTVVENGDSVEVNSRVNFVVDNNSDPHNVVAKRVKLVQSRNAIAGSSVSRQNVQSQKQSVSLHDGDGPRNDGRISRVGTASAAGSLNEKRRSQSCQRSTRHQRDSSKHRTSKQSNNVTTTTANNVNQESPHVDAADEDNDGMRSKRVVRKLRPFNGQRQSQMKDGISTKSLQGAVVSLQEHFGFIKPITTLPPSYRQQTNVYFRLCDVHSADLALIVGDTVSFTLSTKNPSKPSAFRLQLVNPARRTAEVVDDWLTQTLERLEDVMDESSCRPADVARECVTAQPESDETGSGSSQAVIERDAIIDLTANTGVWLAVGRCQSLTDEHVVKIIDVLIKIMSKCKNMQHGLKNIFRCLWKTSLFDIWTGALHAYIVNAVTRGNAKQLTLVRTVLLAMISNVPESCHTVIGLIKPMINSGKDGLEQFLFSALKTVAKTNVCDLDSLEWNELPLVPSCDELTGNLEQFHANLRPVLTHGAYKSNDEYLDTYFRLLRADCFGSLCRSVREMLDGKLDHRNMNVYKVVRLDGITVSHQEGNLMMSIKVDPVIPVTDWSTTSKLMFGNLLCISPSGTFRDPIWASVTSRDLEILKKSQCIFIELCTAHNDVTDAEAVMLLTQSNGRMVMVESPTYYLAYKPVLKTLQSMNPSTIPFQDELVKVSRHQHLPQYVKKELLQRSTDSSKRTCLDEAAKIWPETLDAFQRKAMRNALHRRVACIQGPPGTGKTFIGINLVRSILGMTSRPEGPILVLTYKNHALDEFLKGLLQYFPDDVIRIGGRSKEPEIEACNLKQRRYDVKRSRTLNQNIHDVKDNVGFMSTLVADATRQLNRSQMFTAHTVLTYMNKNQIVSLLLECKWEKAKISGESKTHIEAAINKVKTAEGDFHSVINNDQNIVPLVDAAIKQWLPERRTITEFEKQHAYSQNAADYLSSMYAQAASATLNDNMGDETDIQDAQEERLTAVDYSTLRSSDLIRFNEAAIPCYFISHEHYYNQLPVAHLQSNVDVWTLSSLERLQLVQCLLMWQMEEPVQQFAQTLQRFEELCRQKKELEDQHKIDVLRSAKVIGMTMTGASIYSDLLVAVQPAIVLVEEAAEVLEPHIIAALGPWVQHLIMIGDHKQLRPTVVDYTLTTACDRFHFDISLMERLINNEMPFDSLGSQNRMRPEFAELLLDIYPDLRSAPKVSNNQPANCIVKSMFFWHHIDPEQAARSYSNEKEADRCVKLALHLIQHGCPLDKITLLAAYQGQVGVLRKMVRQAQIEYPKLFQMQSIGTDKNTKEDDKGERSKCLVAVHTIDMYQGDENDFVIVSLVRSNEKKKIGFLKLLNRRCVAQSRARCGLYFVGNSKTLSESSSDWLQMINKMKSAESFGERIAIKCPKHESSIAMIVTGSDSALKGFCKMKCDYIFDKCRHECTELCHPLHEHSGCKTVVLFTCQCGREGKRKCSQKESEVECGSICGKPMHCEKHLCQRNCKPLHRHSFCTEKVDYNCSKCGGINTKMCSQEEREVRCEKDVLFTFAVCGHTTKRKCYEDETSFKCKEPCSRPFPLCGHPCTMKCGEVCNPATCKPCKHYRESLRAKRVEQLKIKLKELQDATEDEFVRSVLEPRGDTAAEYYKISDMVIRYVQPDHRWTPKITKIEKVVNRKLEIAYLKCRIYLKDPEVEELKFHGTSVKAVEAIIREGFRLPSRSGMYGKGIYFATDSSKSAQEKYTQGSHMLIVCMVALGRYKTIYSACTSMNIVSLWGEGYDSVFASRNTREIGGVKFDEFIVFRPEQAVPRYIVHYDVNLDSGVNSEQ